MSAPPPSPSPLVSCSSRECFTRPGPKGTQQRPPQGIGAEACRRGCYQLTTAPRCGQSSRWASESLTHWAFCPKAVRCCVGTRRGYRYPLRGRPGTSSTLRLCVMAAAMRKDAASQPVKQRLQQHNTTIEGLFDRRANAAMDLRKLPESQ